MRPCLHINPTYPLFLPSYLVPKLNKPVSAGKSAFTIRHHPYGHKPEHVRPTRAYKMKALRGRNLTLNNSSRRPYSYVLRALLYCCLINLGAAESPQSDQTSTLKSLARASPPQVRPCLHPCFSRAGEP